MDLPLYPDINIPIHEYDTQIDEDPFKLSRQFGSFGYRGRIAPNFIKRMWVQDETSEENEFNWDNWLEVDKQQMNNVLEFDMPSMAYYEPEPEYCDDCGNEEEDCVCNWGDPIEATTKKSMYKIAYQNVDEVIQDPPQTYPNVGHEPTGIAWVYFGGELKTAPSHANLARILTDEVGMDMAEQAIFHGWKGRYSYDDQVVSASIVLSPTPVTDVPIEVLETLKNHFSPVAILLFDKSYLVAIYDGEGNKMQEMESKLAQSNRFMKYAQQRAKDDFVIQLTDTDRYIADKYEIYGTLRHNRFGYSVGCYIKSTQLGGTAFSQYWHYTDDELNSAKNTFKDVKVAAEELQDEFEYEVMPFSLLRPMFRARMNEVDVDHKENSGVVGYNRYLDTKQVADWRVSLYGTRYPERSYGTLRGLTREASVDKIASMNPFRWISQNWGYGIPLATFMGWYAAAGGTLDTLKADMEQGKNLEQIVQRVEPQQMPDEMPSIETPSIETPILEEQEPKQQSIEKVKLPRGIRNNNPGNIELNKTKWQGMSDEQSDGRFIQFESPEYGIRAIARILRNYDKRYGLNTIEGIINRWAPAVENDTESYIRHVEQITGMKRNQPLDLSNSNQLAKLISAIIAHENGMNNYSNDMILRGIDLETPKQMRMARMVQDLSKADAKKMLFTSMTSCGSNWNCIAKSLQDNGVPKEFMGWLNSLFLQYNSARSGNLSQKSWQMKYSSQG